MTYKEKYFEIINNGLKEKPEAGYYEKHHIVPKSICTILKNVKQNWVYLTAKNHFLAHYYIWKWFRDELHDKNWTKKMCFAFNMMKRIITKSDDIDELSKLYEEVRIDLSETRKGEGNPMYGKHPSEETKMKMSQSRKGKRRTESTKKKISESLKGNKYTDERKMKIGKANSKPVLQYTKDGIFIKEWASITDVINKLQICNISRCCKGIYKQAGGFIWKYKEEKTEI